MSQSTDGSTLRSLRQEHRELVTALKVKKGLDATIQSLPSTNRATNIAWLEKAIKGLKAQLDTKTTDKKPPKSNRKGKWTKKTALQFVDSFESSFDKQTVKDIEDLRKRSKAKKVPREIMAYDNDKKLYEWLRKEFGI